MRSKELRQDRARLIEHAGAILTKAASEGRSMNPEERTQFEAIHAKSDELWKDIQAEELQEQRTREIAETVIAAREQGAVTRSSDPHEQHELDMRAFRSYLRNGINGMSDEERSVARLVDAEGRAAQTVTTTGGGYLVPRGFQAELDVAMLAFSDVRRACRVIPTATGNTMDWPTVNDTSNKGRLLAINTVVTNTGLTYGAVVLGAYLFSSDSVLVPYQLAQDSAFDIDAHVRDMLAERLGRITNDYFTTGTGSSQPTGIVTGAYNSSVVFDVSDIASNNNMTTVGSKIIDLEHTVDPAYRVGAAYMMHDGVKKILRTTVDGNGRPLFRAANDAPGDFDTLNGYPVFINQSMGDWTATNKVMLFGNFSKFLVRVVRPVTVMRLVERYADYHQIGFLGFERADSNIINAGTNPIKYAALQA